MFSNWASGRWQYLAYASFQVPAAELQGVLPSGMASALENGAAWVSLVAGRCTQARYRGIPVLGPGGFFRVRLQTYVKGPQGVGVYPLQELYSQRSLAVLSEGWGVAKAREAPVTLDISFSPGEEVSEGSVRYRWGDGAELALTTERLPYPEEFHAEEHFLVGPRRTYVRGRVLEADRGGWFLWDGKIALNAEARQGWDPRFAKWLLGEPQSSLLVKGGPAQWRWR